MSDTIQSLSLLKSKIAAAQAKADRAAGVLDQILSTLKKDWDCQTIDDAKAKLASMTKKLDRLSAEFKEKSKKFEETWGDELSRLS